MLSLCACTTPISVKPTLDDSLTAPCPRLPDAQVKVGEDIRLAAQRTRALDVRMYNECAASKDALLDAVK